MRFLTSILLVVILSGCTSVQHSTRISTRLVTNEYNSVYSKYMERPTFVSIEKMSDDNIVLAVFRDNYGSTFSPIRFSKENVPNYIELIDKYFEWEKLARSRGDLITKEIGEANSWGNTASGSLRFKFHSGNSAEHYLSISFCAVGTCLDEQALYLDVNNAKELKNLLLQLDEKTQKAENINDVYK
ncbi:hypothetical protein [Aeromonas sp. QDB62]|uniref:hypothetical protein n=1 Tax=Aeromonas sp. QDB62 TaxID=2990499 RepID=UPI0022E46CEC|nr:hypothetical protein [Aeromonas sp. QDB62]